MENKRHIRSAAFILPIMLLCSFFLVSCGGDGDSAPPAPNPAPSTEAVWDQANWDEKNWQ
jgi:hypothetical protein